MFQPDGKRLATAGGDAYRTEATGAITIWDTATGEELKRLEGVGAKNMEIRWGIPSAFSH